MRISILIVAFFLTSLVVQGQVISSVSVSKDSLTLGESFQIIYKLSFLEEQGPELINFNPFYEIESLAHPSADSLNLAPIYADFETDALFTEYENKSVPAHLFRIYDRGDQNEIRDTFNVKFWDIGVFRIPHPKFEIDSSLLQRPPIYLESPIIIVLPPMEMQPQDTTQMILDIKDIITTPKGWRSYLKYLYFLAAILIGILVFRFLKPKDQNEVVVPVIKKPDPAHVIALRRLDKLKTEELWKTGQIKAYQSELTFTLREYLENRYEIPALENTTDEIISSVIDLKLNEIQINDIKEILQIADMVKFAKAKPSEDIHSQFLVRTRSFVLNTKKELVENQNLVDE